MSTSNALIKTSEDEHYRAMPPPSIHFHVFSYVQTNVTKKMVKRNIPKVDNS